MCLSAPSELAVFRRLSILSILYLIYCQLYYQADRIILFPILLRFSFTISLMRKPVLHSLSFTCLLLLAGMQVLAQEAKQFKGIIVDSIDKTLPEKCTVILQPKNGPTQRTLSNEKGIFSFAAKADSVLLIVKHVGYKELRLPVLISEKQSSLDTIFLAPLEQVMEDVVIKAKVPPIVIRGDTTEFSIDSAMFEPYDVVEDLIKRLPGLEMDAEGKMTFQGKSITRILVDGEDLFGGDPTFSMKKLPAGLVAKIQVMDTKTLEQIFNGTPGDSDDKTLNIKLKGGNKTFGSADALAGTKNQFESNAMLSMFDGAKRMSAMGSFNSSNKIGLAKMKAEPTSSSANASINYGNRWGAIRFNTSYGYTESGNSNKLYRERTQIITADTSFFTRSNNRTDYGSGSHRFNVSANWAIDSTSILDVNLSYTGTKSNSENGSSSITTEKSLLRNESFGQSSSAGDYQTLGATLFWAKRFNKKGRNISINARTNTNYQTTNLYTTSTNTYFKNGQPISGDTLDRNTKTINTTRGYSVAFSYSEPISKGLRINLQNNLDFNKTKTSRAIYNLDSFLHTAEYDSLYSAEILSSYNTQNLGASLVYNDKKLNLTTGFTTVLQQTLRTLNKDVINQTLLRYSPSVNATYILSKEKSLRANFYATTIQPTIDQLQPVPDNTNPLYIRIGNPDLHTAFSQNYGLTYNYYSLKNSMATGLIYSPVSNQIVNAVYYDEFRKQTSRFINVAGVYSLRGNFSITKMARQDKRSERWSFSSSGTYGQQVFFQSNNQYYSRSYSTQGEMSFGKAEAIARPTRYRVALSSSFNRNWTPANTSILNTTRLTISPGLEGGCTVAGFIYVTLSYGAAYNKLDYHSMLRGTDEYSSHFFASNINFQIKKRFSLQSAFTYTYNTQVPAGSSKGAPNLNLYASAYVFKGGKGQVSLSALNLLAANNELRRTVGENFIEDLQLTSLRNYFTLKFQYNFSRIDNEKKAVKK